MTTAYSISASLLAIEWADHRINLIDAPGYADFEGEVVSGTVAADAALVAVDGSSGVQGGTEIAWAHADAAGPLPQGRGRHPPRPGETPTSTR